ncbi:MAG: hypothetical protein LBT55_00605 [Clostridiaceae bacterium]|jgi:hypothetical protein|nr:hypothetical protein [Clostridiaceae bacterium]
MSYKAPAALDGAAGNAHARTAKELVYAGVFAALLSGAKLALRVIPNVEVVTLLIILYASFAGGRAVFCAVTVFCTIEFAIYGFGTWVPLYYIYWNLLGFAAWLLLNVLPKNAASRKREPLVNNTKHAVDGEDFFDNAGGLTEKCDAEADTGKQADTGITDDVSGLTEKRDAAADTVIQADTDVTDDMRGEIALSEPLRKTAYAVLVKFKRAVKRIFAEYTFRASVLAAVFTVFFGVLSSGVDVLFAAAGGVPAAQLNRLFVVFYVRGLWFYGVHFVSNVFILVFSYGRLRVLLKKILRVTF